MSMIKTTKKWMSMTALLVGHKLEHNMSWLDEIQKNN